MTATQWLNFVNSHGVGEVGAGAMYIQRGKRKFGYEYFFCCFLNSGDNHGMPRFLEG